MGNRSTTGPLSGAPAAHPPASANRATHTGPLKAPGVGEGHGVVPVATPAKHPTHKLGGDARGGDGDHAPTDGRATIRAKRAPVDLDAVAVPPSPAQQAKNRHELEETAKAVQGGGFGAVDAKDKLKDHLGNVKEDTVAKARVRATESRHEVTTGKSEVASQTAHAAEGNVKASEELVHGAEGRVKASQERLKAASQQHTKANADHVAARAQGGEVKGTKAARSQAQSVVKQVKKEVTAHVLEKSKARQDLGSHQAEARTAADTAKAARDEVQAAKHELDAAKVAAHQADLKLRGKAPLEPLHTSLPLTKGAKAFKGTGSAFNIAAGGLAVRDGLGKMADGAGDLANNKGSENDVKNRHIDGSLKILAGAGDAGAGAAGVVDGGAMTVQVVARSSTLAARLMPIGVVAGRVAVPIAGAANVIGGVLDIRDGMKMVSDPKAKKGAGQEKIFVGGAKSLWGAMMVAGAGASLTGAGAVAGVPLMVVGSVVTAGAAIYENREAIVHFLGNASDHLANWAHKKGLL